MYFLGIEVKKLSWRVDVCAYVTGAKPSDPEPRNRNGFALIALVSSGTSRAIIGKGTQYIKMIECPESAAPVLQLPVPGGGVANGNDQDRRSHIADV
ncbi:hypothetical protein CCMSSC00406_0008510 [Pleurotus cornucopiae]|uniref:Uncharacterized protein n=1 Tax=Pleurotus cornucopiae TaxID=5321 RepID=A0ACB7IZD3_PLECO|nr:hypothetical protein CCMSSC00406_0008510 [Pleurotus cornucopiae]